MSWNDFKQNPSFFCLVNDLKISPIYMMELFCLIGILLSSICFLSHFIRHNLTFIIFMILWLLYLSLYCVGQTFLSFQWDILLLEVGFLTCFISSSSTYSGYNNIIFFCIRWLLFRLMFSSFIVKLQSNCITWWNLTALDWHYQSTCIPTPASWYFHNLPKWFNHLSVVITYLIEGPLSIIYILPTHFNIKYIFRFTRFFAVYCNILLMILIQFTGNYNFFNLLTIIITFSCFDDEHINYIIGKTKRVKQIKTNYIKWLFYLIEFLVWCIFITLTIYYFSLNLKKNDKTFINDYDGLFGKFVYFLDEYQIKSKINFGKDFSNLVASKFIMIGVIIGEMNILFCIISDFITNFSEFFDLFCTKRKQDTRNRINCFGIIILIIVFIYRLFSYIIKIFVGVIIFHISLIPFLHGIDQYQYTKQYIISETYMNYIRNDWYFKFNNFHLVSSYGLFRRMTGVGARPEIEIYVSGYHNPQIPFNDKYILNITQLPDDDEHRGWYQVPFLYKPGDVNNIPGWIAPHQPRLDWQMWFAALGNYQNNPWFISFLYRLITPKQSTAIYDLIDDKKYIYSPYFSTYLKTEKTEKKKKRKIKYFTKIFIIII